MPKIYEALAACTPSSEAGAAYVYSIIPTAENGVAAITSANELLILDRLNLSTSPVLRLRDVPQKVSCLVSGDVTGSSVICSGGDGSVATFDVRSQSRISHFKTDRAVTALACVGDKIAIGTELSHYQAVVSVWDRRQNKCFWQNSENNDDITVVDFHPTRQNVLLAGGDDGQVGIFDTSISDEDESLIQGVNHGPIHKAGFLGDQRFFALSSDQNLSIYPVSSAGDDEDPPPTLLGDMRSSISCDYIIDVLKTGTDYAIAAGSNISKTQIDIVELRHATNLSKSPKVKLDSRYVLEGSHGEEIVRSIFADSTNGSIFTGGEDGQIKQFQSISGEEESSTKLKTPKPKRPTETRYKPY